MEKIKGKALKKSLSIRRQTFGRLNLTEYYSMIEQVSYLSAKKRKQLITANRSTIKSHLRDDLKNQNIVIEV